MFLHCKSYSNMNFITKVLLSIQYKYTKTTGYKLQRNIVKCTNNSLHFTECIHFFHVFCIKLFWNQRPSVRTRFFFTLKLKSHSAIKNKINTTKDNKSDPQKKKTQKFPFLFKFCSSATFATPPFIQTLIKITIKINIKKLLKFMFKFTVK